MWKSLRSGWTLLIILLFLILLVGAYPSLRPEQVPVKPEYTHSHREGPPTPPNEVVFGGKTSVEDVAAIWKRQGVMLYLPTWLPEGMKLTAVYVRMTNNTIIGPPFFIYSYRQMEDSVTAELQLEITPDPQCRPKGGWPPGNFTKIGDFDAYVTSGFHIGRTEYIELYDETANLVALHVGSMNYLFRGIPSIQISDLIKIAENIEKVQIPSK